MSPSAGMSCVVSFERVFQSASMRSPLVMGWSHGGMKAFRAVRIVLELEDY
jgi:hypothetical protein